MSLLYRQGAHSHYFHLNRMQPTAACVQAGLEGAGATVGLKTDRQSQLHLKKEKGYTT